MRWNARSKIMRQVNKARGVRTESVIQDVDIPVESATEFLAFLQHEIRITPIWMCPIKPLDCHPMFTLFPMRPGQLYINFGFWDVVQTHETYPSGYFNRLVEEKVRALDGLKSLYSDSFYSKDEFWEIFDAQSYASLKEKYDPFGRLKGLYEKCVLRA